MLKRSFLFLVFALLFCHASVSRAQEKQLTIDDIFDPSPAKRVNFNGTPSVPRWLKDGVHYLVVSKDRNAFPRLLKVNAVTGASEPFYDAAKMQAAFAALPGFIKEDARRLANQTTYQLNPAETGVLINFANDLFYYEFGSDRAIRLTNSPEEEVGESFSPDGRMVSFIRGNNLYVEDLGMQRRERALTRDAAWIGSIRKSFTAAATLGRTGGAAIPRVSFSCSLMRIRCRTFRSSITFRSISDWS